MERMHEQEGRVTPLDELATCLKAIDVMARDDDDAIGWILIRLRTWAIERPGADPPEALREAVTNLPRQQR